MKAARIFLSAPLALTLVSGNLFAADALPAASSDVPSAETTPAQKTVLGVTITTERAGTVIAVDPEGEVYTIDLGDEVVSPGSILQVYRRLPSARGTAAYRDEVVWWEVGQLTVTATGGTMAIASWSAEPTEPIPGELDESGAPSAAILIGDRVRSTGAIGPRTAPVRVTFSRADLFGAGEDNLGESGGAFFASWLDGVRSMEGPIEVEVHPRLEALGLEKGQRNNGTDSGRDYPLGPTLNRPTNPSRDLYDETLPGVKIPEGREVLVVGEHEGKPDVWHYVDPVRMARRQGDSIADALAAYLGVDPTLILVRVVPRALETDAGHEKVPGYEKAGDQVRILATGIEYIQPEVEGDQRRPASQQRRPQRRPRAQPPRTQPEQPRRRRRLLERPPEVSRAGGGGSPPDA